MRADVMKIVRLDLYGSPCSNSLSPVLTNFMTYPFLPLSATLTQFETSVGGWGPSTGGDPAMGVP